MLRRVMSYVLTFTMTWTTTWAAIPSIAQEPRTIDVTYEQAQLRLEQSLQLISALRAHIDRSQFDLDVLIEKLDFDSEEIIEFVRSEIYFEQYSGLLRGARGTLMSRAGNSLDQSVLLAKLLKDAGFDARVTRGRLTANQAHELLKQMQIARSPAKYPLDLKGLAKAFLRAAEEFGATPAELQSLRDLLNDDKSKATGKQVIDSDYVEQSKGEAREIINLLGERGVDLKPKNDTSNLSEEARDYFWVEWRETSSGPWIQVHPAFASETQAPVEIDPLEFFQDEIPEELQHRFRIDVSVDQDFAGEPRTHRLMTPWEVPAANLVGTTISYLNLPEYLMSQAGYSDPDLSIENSSFFVPVFNGQIPAGAMAFDVNGTVVSPDALASGYAGVFRTVFDKGEKAATAIGNLGSDSAEEKQDLIALTAHHVDFVFISPGGAERIVRRTPFDRKYYPGLAGSPNDDALAAASKRMKRKLSEELTFIIAVGEYPSAYVLDKTLERIVNGRGLLELAIDKAFFPDVEQDLNRAKGADLSWGQHLTLLSLFDRGMELGPDAVSYRAEPSVVSHRRELRIGEDVRATVDIVKNDKRTLNLSGSKTSEDPQLAVNVGVWETWAESLVAAGATTKLASSAGLIERAQENDIEIQVLSPGEVTKVEALQLPQDSKDAISRDLLAGYHVLTPVTTLPDSRDWGLWYRVNAGTGETLGMAGNGVGGAITEFVILVIAVAAGVLMFLMVLEDCWGGGPSNTDSASVSGKAIGCILCATIAGLVAGLIVFEALTILASTAAIGAAVADTAGATGLSLARLQIIAASMLAAEIPAEIVVMVLVQLIREYLCTATSLTFHGCTLDDATLAQVIPPATTFHSWSVESDGNNRQSFIARRFTTPTGAAILTTRNGIEPQYCS